jgi:hypothetical protein
MSTKSLGVLRLEFWKGASANFEGYFIMNSYDAILMEIKKEINESTIEIPKYQLIVKTENAEAYHIIDCWIDRFEFENHKYEHTKCYFLCNDIKQVNTISKR